MVKPVKMWAVYGPTGILVDNTITKRARYSQIEAEIRLGLCWKTLKKRGVTCRRVTVTPVREGGKG